MLVFGVDPGLTGALVWVQLFPELRLVRASDMPVQNGRVDARSLVALCRTEKPGLAVLEDVHSMPGQGVHSVFSFGDSFGCARTALVAAGYKVVLVRPECWKAALGVPASKDGARVRASALFGSDRWWPRKKDHGRAEAALLALMGGRL